MSESRTQAYAERSFEPMVRTLLRRGRRAGVWLAAAGLSALALGVPAAGAAAQEPGEGARLRIDVEGLVDAPLAAVRGVLLDLDAFAGWFPRLAAWRVLSRDGAAARVYGRQDLPWPVRDRDYVVDYRWWEAPDGSFVLEARSLAAAEPSPPDGVVREEAFRSEWRLEPVAGGVRARYRYEAEADNPLERWLARVAWRPHTRAVLDGLAGEVARRAAGGAGTAD